MFGDLKYPPHFPNFDYVNPRAPKAGAVRQGASGTFDNFNIAVAGRKGILVVAIDLIYETLLTSSFDEVSSAYGLLAGGVSHPSDFSSVTYRLRPAAKWHDGSPITPEDVVFYFNAFKKHSPRLAAYYRHVMSAEVTGPQVVTFLFDTTGNRELRKSSGN